jgi:hypothetical protein
VIWPANLRRLCVAVHWSPFGTLDSPEARVQLDAFRQGLRQLGYTEGRNVAIEYRGAGARIERFPTLAAELVRLQVDHFVATHQFGRYQSEADMPESVGRVN